MYKLMLCLRYLRSRYIALASIISVTLGVATMIVVNSVMAGFTTEMRDRIHGILADVIIETNDTSGATNSTQQMAIVNRVAGDKIEAMTATVEIYGMLSFQYAGQWITRPVTLIGIDPEGKAQVGPLRKYLSSYNPTMEETQIVAPALRQPDEPLSWELSQSALAYRKRRIERQQFMNGRFSTGHGSEFAPEAIESPFEEQENSSTQGKPVPPPKFDETPPPNSEQSFDEPGEKIAKQPASPADGTNPFPDSPDSGFDSPAPPVDPTAPLKGRLYIGRGLVSFPYEAEDPDTGQMVMKTMMMIQPGDDVKLSTVTSGRPPEAAHFNATIVDVFKSGMSEYDSNLIFCNLEYLQEIRGMVDPVTDERAITSIQLKLKNFDDAKEVIRNLRAAFPPGIYTIRTWEQKQGPLLAAVEVESGILNVLLFMIIAVAGFGILAIFFMIVVEKTRDIGILKALGASSRGVMSIFLGYGLGLGIVGSGVGSLLGLAFVHYINEIEDILSTITGRKVFDEKIYYFPEIPTSISPAMVLWVSLGAMLIAVLASIFPARRAARLKPVEALRYDG